MSHFAAGILRIVILEAAAGLALVERWLPVRQVRRAAIVMAALAVLAWTNFGQLRGHPKTVHLWEQYHFFFGSKYLKEIGYFDLYKATLLADRESVHRLGGVTETRDLRTFEVIAVADALADAPAVRARFSEARWQAFKEDWVAFSTVPLGWTSVLRDHGNSASPAWGLLAFPIASLLPVSPFGQNALAALDLLLMIALFVNIFRAFGVRAGCLALTAWALVPFSFDYLAGSFLRWDWLFATGMSLCYLKRGRPILAGAFLGYAVVSKLFPIFFGVAWLARVGFDVARERKIAPRQWRFAAAAAAVALTCVLLSSALFRGPWVWREYKQRIDVARVEKYYPNQYSLRTVFLQWVNASPGEVLAPRDIAQGRPDVDIGRHRVAFLIVQLALSALLVLSLRRADEWAAFALGPFFVLVWLVVNAYYWNMLAFPVLAFGAAKPRTRGRTFGLVGLFATLAVFYFTQHLNRAFAEAYTVASLLLAVLLGSALFEIVDHRRRARQAGEVELVDEHARGEPLPADTESR